MLDFFKTRSPKPSDAETLLIDIGGTNTRIAFSADGATLGRSTVIKTSQEPEAGLAGLREAADRLRGRTAVRAVVCGVAGALTSDRRKLHYSPHLPLWEGEDIVRFMEDVWDAPVRLENDAALGGLGEAMRGAGKGNRIVVFMTISTGIGGVRIVDGQIDRHSGAFEPGHQIIDFSDRLHGGTLETYVAGSSIERRYGLPPWEITDDGIHRELAARLAAGVYNAALFWSPDVIVLGGPLVLGQNPIPFALVAGEFRELSGILPKAPGLVKAALGDSGGLIGALVLSESGS